MPYAPPSSPISAAPLDDPTSALAQHELDFDGGSRSGFCRVDLYRQSRRPRQRSGLAQVSCIFLLGRP